MILFREKSPDNELFDHGDRYVGSFTVLGGFRFVPLVVYGVVSDWLLKLSENSKGNSLIKTVIYGNIRVQRCIMAWKWGYPMNRNKSLDFERKHEDDLQRLRGFRLLDDDFMSKVFEDKKCAEFYYELFLTEMI